MSTKTTCACLIGAALLLGASSAAANPPTVIDPANEWVGGDPNAKAPKQQRSPLVQMPAGAAEDEPSYASDYDEPRQRETDFPCFLASDAGCDDWYPHIELGMAWGESHTNIGWQWHYRLWAEIGALGPVEDEPDLHIGPVFNIGADFGRVTNGYSANTRLKLRYWIAGSPINMDFGVGPSIARYSFREGTESGTRMGGITDLSFGALGIGSIYGSSTYHVDLADSSESEVRLLAGVRGSLLMWGYVLSLVGRSLR